MQTISLYTPAKAQKSQKNNSFSKTGESQKHRAGWRVTESRIGLSVTTANYKPRFGFFPDSTVDTETDGR